MKRLALAPLILVVILALVAMGGGAVTADLSPPQQVAQLKKQIRQLRLDKAELQDQVDAQDAVLADQAATIQRLRARLASQPDPLDAVLARDPDGLWAAMLAIWRAFPALPEGQLCGYDKSTVPDSGIGLTLTSFEFLRISGC